MVKPIKETTLPNCNFMTRDTKWMPLNAIGRKMEYKDLTWEDEIMDSIYADENIEDLAEELFNYDKNYKHCDPTTGQKCWSTIQDLRDRLEEELEVIRGLEDNCGECGSPMQDEGYKVVNESRPGIGIDETIVVGYKCAHCGYEENY